MNLLHAVLLGIVQGLTEFIPVSSTAHLFITSGLLGLPADDRTFAFNVIIQLGTVASLILYFWRDISEITWSFILGMVNRKPFEDFHSRLGWLVFVATIPAGLIGLAFNQFAKNMSGEPLLWAGIRLLFTSVLLATVEYLDKKNRTLESATWQDALSVGLFQVLAIFPGASRTGATMAGAMFRGFDRPSAARFALLMSTPILLAAGLYETVQVILLPNTTEFLPMLITGFIVSGIVGWIAIRWLLAYLRNHSLYVFSAYCLLAGIVVFLLK